MISLLMLGLQSTEYKYVGWGHYRNYLQVCLNSINWHTEATYRNNSMMTPGRYNFVVAVVPEKTEAILFNQIRFTAKFFKLRLIELITKMLYAATLPKAFPNSFQIRNPFLWVNDVI